MATAEPVKHPQRTKRYTPPKVLGKPQPEPTVPSDEPTEVPESHVVSIPPLPTAVRVEPWGQFGVILRLENVLHRGTFTITWEQVKGILHISDQIASKVIEAQGGEGADEDV